MLLSESDDDSLRMTNCSCLDTRRTVDSPGRAIGLDSVTWLEEVKGDSLPSLLVRDRSEPVCAWERRNDPGPTIGGSFRSAAAPEISEGLFGFKLDPPGDGALELGGDLS